MDRPIGDVEPEALRLAIISTPRSGNTWLRRLLAAAYGLRELGAGTPEDVDWDALPTRCILQIHWLPEAGFVERLRRAGMGVIVVARHPLDVLLSALNFNEHTHPGEGCISADCGRCAILGAAPQDPAFLDYACGPWGGELLAFSPAWWGRPGALPVVYERLLEDPAAVLSGLIERIGRPPTGVVAEAVAANTPSKMRSSFGADRHHIWQASAGLWRSLIAAAPARAIFEARRDAFEALGYACDPDEALTPAEAERTWARLQLDSARRLLAEERLRSRAALADVAEAERRSLSAIWEREVSLGQRDAAHAETLALRSENQRLAREVADLSEALVVARSGPDIAAGQSADGALGPIRPRTKRPSGIMAWRRRPAGGEASAGV